MSVKDYLKRLGLILFLALVVVGCGTTRSASVKNRGTKTVVTMQLPVMSLPRQISVPSWIDEPGVTDVSLGSASGYILNATHNAVIWQQKAWRFQVVGPFVAIQPTEADFLQNSVQNSAFSGIGVVQLHETSHLWRVAISWESAHTVWGTHFAIAGTNTDMIPVIVLQLTRRHTLGPDVLACRVVLRSADGGTTIADVADCRFRR